MTTNTISESNDATRPDHARRTRSLSRYLPAVARVLMGLIFLGSGVFGLLIAAGVVPLPQPPTPPPPGAAAFLEGMMKSGYFFPFLKATEAIVGALLLANRFVLLALVVIAPVVVNIVAFHAILEPSGIAPALVILVLEVYLAWVHREAYRPLLAMRANAGAAGAK